MRINGDKPHPERKLSRRDFARAAVLVATAAVPNAGASNYGLSEGQNAVSQTDQLPPEAEARFQAIVAKHGSRLSADQRADVRRLLGTAQKTSDALRAFPLENSDEPANVFRIYRNEKTPGGRR